MSPLSIIHHIFIYIIGTKLAATSFSRRGRMVVPPLSFKFHFVFLEFQRGYCFPHAYAGYHASPILYPRTSLELLACIATTSQQA